MANILLSPLMQLTREFHDLLRPGGNIVLSGILANQAEECLARYRPWFNMEEPCFRNEWAMLCGTRRTDTAPLKTKRNVR